MPDHFETDRLVASRVRLEDHDLLVRVHRDPQVMATLGGPKDEAQTDRYLARHLDLWERHGCGLWKLHTCDGRFAGICILRHAEVNGIEEVELGYALFADFWGAGLATEVARALVQMGLRHHGFASVVAFTRVDNYASRRVLEKAGLRFEREFTGDGPPEVLYRLRREDLPEQAFTWAQALAAPAPPELPTCGEAVPLLQPE
jgi:RimJ/RimL family protein N-acetyltransferase